MGLIKSGHGSSKLYVSISKQAPKKTVHRVLTYLRAFDVSVYTYDGSTVYDVIDLEDMDFMVVIGPDQGNRKEDGNKHFKVGRGNFDEIQYFRNHCPTNNLFIISDLHGGLYVDEYADSKKFSECIDWDNWGEIITYDQMIDIVNYNIPSEAEHRSAYYELVEAFDDEDSNPDPDYMPDVPAPPGMREQIQKKHIHDESSVAKLMTEHADHTMLIGRAVAGMSDISLLLLRRRKK